MTSTTRSGWQDRHMLPIIPAPVRADEGIGSFTLRSG